MNEPRYKDKTYIEVTRDGGEYMTIGGSYYCGNCGFLVGSRDEKNCRSCKEAHDWSD